MSVTPITLAHGAAPNPEAPIYTVPADTVVVVRHVLVVATALATISMNVNGNRIFAGEQVAANKRIEQWFSGYELGAGATITAGSSVLNALIVLVEGLVLA